MAILKSSVDPLHVMEPFTTEASLFSPRGALFTNQTFPTTSVPLYPSPGLGGVPQPPVSTKELIIIIFMFCLWAYSLFLTYRLRSPWKTDTLLLVRAWYKMLYSDGDERTSMWGFIMDVVRKKRKVQADLEQGQSKVTFPNQRPAFQDPGESEPLKQCEGEGSQMCDGYEVEPNNGHSFLPKKPIYTEV